MNRNSPVPLWAVLGIGVVVLFSVYLLGQAPATSPAASANVKRLRAIPSATSPTSTMDTSNWRTYRNEKFGFELKYPTALGWAPREASGFQSPLTLTLYSNPPSPLEVTISVDPAFDTPQEAAESWKDYDGFESSERFKSSHISGNKVLITYNPGFTTGESPWPEAIKYFIGNPTSTGVLSLTISSFQRSRDEQLSRIVNLILSTFTFLKHS